MVHLNRLTSACTDHLWEKLTRLPDRPSLVMNHQHKQISINKVVRQVRTRHMHQNHSRQVQLAAMVVAVVDLTVNHIAVQ